MDQTRHQMIPRVSARGRGGPPGADAPPQHTLILGAAAAPSSHATTSGLSDKLFVLHLAARLLIALVYMVPLPTLDASRACETCTGK